MFIGWVFVKSKDGSMVERDDFIGEQYVFQKDDEDEEFK